MERLLNTTELAKLLGVATRTVRDLKQRKGLPVYMVGGTIPRYRESDVEEWLEKQKKVSGER